MPLVKSGNPLAVRTSPRVENDHELLPQLVQQIPLAHQIFEMDSLSGLEDREDEHLGIRTPEGGLVPSDHLNEATSHPRVGQQLYVRGQDVMGVGRVSSDVPVEKWKKYSKAFCFPRMLFIVLPGYIDVVVEVHFVPVAHDSLLPFDFDQLFCLGEAFDFRSSYLLLGHNMFRAVILVVE